MKQFKRFSYKKLVITAGMACLIPLTYAHALLSENYDEDIARKYVWLAAAAYCSEASLDAWNCGPPCDNAIIDPKTVHYCYDEDRDVASYVAVAADDNTSAVISFRGTNPASIKDWIDDLGYAKKTPYRNCTECQVHGGFYSSFLALKPQIRQALQALDITRKSTIHITGHSLGAAMAALCAYDLAIDGYRIGTSYTFGQPRVGDNEFAASFKKYMGTQSIYRIVHNEDIVPHLPLQLLDFYHVPREIWYNDKESHYTVCNGSGEDVKCSDGLSWSVSVEDHRKYLNISISNSCKVEAAAFKTPQNQQFLQSSHLRQKDPGPDLLRRQVEKALEIDKNEFKN